MEGTWRVPFLSCLRVSWVVLGCIAVVLGCFAVGLGCVRLPLVVLGCLWMSCGCVGYVSFLLGCLGVVQDRRVVWVVLCWLVFIPGLS